ncbi:TPA: phage baseplate assembly protein V [Vibrio parahaemolyticus]
MSERRTNTSGRMFGKYRAQVTAVEHPQGLYMAQVRLLGVWDKVPSGSLPWAEFTLPLGAKPNAGHAVPVEINDLVWVEFPRNGDTRYPLIVGSVYYAPEMNSNLPNEIDGNGFEQKRAEGEPTPPAYEHTDDIYSRFGLMVHKPSKGGIVVTDRNTGAAIEITPDGQIVVHAESDLYQSGKSIIIKASNDVTVNAKTVSLTSTEKVSIEASAFNFKCAGDFAIDAGGQISVTASDADFKLG